MMSRVAKRMPAAVWIILLWSVAVFPNLSVRSFIWEEGTNAEIARDMLRRGDWLEPTIYGVRWAEKPSLLAGLIAATARLTGTVDEWSARLPAMLSVLCTALLVAQITGRAAGATAALFAAVAFLFSPMLLQKLTISEPDTVITFLSFAAFVVWWRGEQAGRTAAWRWLACGALLAVLTLAKGPQPAAFFALGVVGYFVYRRRWPAPGLVVCLGLPAVVTIAWAAAVYRPGDLSTWLAYMRIPFRFDFHDYLRKQAWFTASTLVELLPGTMLLPFLFFSGRQRPRVASLLPVVSPLLLYAGLGMLALVFWPGAKPRYAMPAAPAVAVLAGFSIDFLWRQAHVAARVAVTTVIALFAYQVALVTVVMPLYADRFGESRLDGTALSRAVAADPAPVLTMGGPHTNQLFYFSRPLRRVDDPSDAAFAAPAWLLVPADQISRIEQRRPDLSIDVRVRTNSGPALVGARIERRR